MLFHRDLVVGLHVETQSHVLGPLKSLIENPQGRSLGASNGLDGRLPEARNW